MNFHDIHCITQFHNLFEGISSTLQYFHEKSCWQRSTQYYTTFVVRRIAHKLLGFMRTLQLLDVTTITISASVIETVMGEYSSDSSIQGQQG